MLSPNTQTHDDIMKTMCTWHQVTDGNGLPLAGRLSSGAEHKLRHALPVVDRICVSKQGAGRPKCRPDSLWTDKGYDGRRYRWDFRDRGIQPKIPSRIWKNRKRRPG